MLGPNKKKGYHSKEYCEIDKRYSIKSRIKSRMKETTIGWKQSTVKILNEVS